MQAFLNKWDETYREALQKIPLFNSILTSQWTLEQKQLFIKLLYHQRGHFDDILWFMGNFAPDAESKKVILGNIQEEFGNHAPSHEQLYLDFAKSHGVDLRYELLDETMYLPFLREYIIGILRWFRSNDWHHRILAFSAIERLDNLDYCALKNIAISFGTPNKYLVFFSTHIRATHYENVAVLDFDGLWQTKSFLVEGVFNFIADYQLTIWEKISSYVFRYAGETQIV